MNRLSWSHHYSVGVQHINMQHKHLFDLVNKFNQALAEKRALTEVSMLFTDLVRYCESHFRDEEELMLLAAYDRSKFDYHKQQHEKLFEDVFAIHEAFAHGEKGAGERLSSFLSNWISTHILKEDKDYMAACKNFSDFKPSAKKPTPKTSL